MVQLLGIGQQARALALGGHGARRTAQVEVDLPIAPGVQLTGGPQEVLRPVGQQLGHHIQPGVVGRVDLVQLLALEGAGGVGGKKGREVFVRRAEQGGVDLPPQITGKPLHGGGVELIHEILPPDT